MKRVFVIPLLALLLSTFVVFTCHGQRAHADGNCTQQSGLQYGYYQGKTLQGTLDLWPCSNISGEGDAILLQGAASFRYTVPSFNDYQGKVYTYTFQNCTMTFGLKTPDGQTVSSQTDDCTWWVQDGSIGVSLDETAYDNSDYSLASGTYAVYVYVSLLYHNSDAPNYQDWWVNSQSVVTPSFYYEAPSW